MSCQTVISPAAGAQDGRARTTAARPGGLSAIGETPVVRLAHLTDDRCAEVWVTMKSAVGKPSSSAPSVVATETFRVRQPTERASFLNVQAEFPLSGARPWCGWHA